MSDAQYIHGTTLDEQRRLAALNRLTNPPFVAFVNPQPGQQVLEIGSGLGLLAHDLSCLVGDGHVTGVEYSVDQLRAAPRDPRLTFVQGDAHCLPWPDEHFDLVYCRYLLEHVARPEVVLREAHRVLKPGGRFCTQENDILVSVLDPECAAFEQLWRQFTILQQRLGGDARVGKRLLPLLQQAGFTSIKLSIQPEVHWSGSPGFEPWIDNLLGNVVGAADHLVATGLATPPEIAAATQELQQFKQRPDATAWFYWNRAEGVKR
ncbi:MAG: methyltransferase domain-containing protein [Planctomycetaceae bacterium]|nr:methyltransferase domain-containing protein [Planctomycetaceae bacterium]